jgi:hypothetical protein
MKKNLFITLSAMTALFFVVAVQAWEEKCATFHPGSFWHSCDSDTILVSSTVTAYIYANAPFTTATNCGERKTEAVRVADPNVVVATSTCPGVGESSTPECCVKSTFTANSASIYYARGTQAAGGNQTCGPTAAKISSVNYSCTPE